MKGRTATALATVVAAGLVFAALAGCGRVPATTSRAEPTNRQDGSDAAPVVPSPVGPMPTTAERPGYPGFEGPDGAFLTTLPKDGKVVVLASTITTTTSGKWRAWGLVRNETPQAAGEVRVTAKLLNGAGEVLAAPSTTVPVRPLRSGEPGPFAITSSVPVKDVARVKWQADASLDSGGMSRAIDVQVYWQAPYGISDWRGLPRDDPPYPHLVRMGMENLGVPLQSASATIAWVERGKVLWVETTPLDTPAAGLPPGFVLATGSGANFKVIRISDPQVAEYAAQDPLRLHRAEYWLWGQGQPVKEE